MDRVWMLQSGRNLSVVFSITVFLSLAACGGDGAIEGDTSSSTTTPSPTPGPGSGSAPTLSFSANPLTIQSGQTSTLTWSSTGATACTASNGWTGSKPPTGSESTGQLTATRSYRIECVNANGSVNRTVTVSVSETNPSPPPPIPAGTIGGYPMPSLQDERNTYTAWGWTWSVSKEPGAVTEPTQNYYVGASDVDVRNDPEADDLWNYLMMYRRSGNVVYLNRAQAWLRYYKQDYVTDVVNDDAVNNHLFGWGLIAWYEHTCAQGSCDTEALNVAEQIGALAESAWSGAVPGQTSMANYGARRAGRPLLLATRLADVTKKQRWISLRDHLISLWIQSPDWDARGFYEIGPEDTNTVAGSGAYAAGYRVQSAFQIGILSEAFDHAYRSTGNNVLRDRIVAMANYAEQYGIDPVYKYTGSYIGFTPAGTAWHNYFASCGNSCTFSDPSYTTSLVNTLVRGYIYTGQSRYLERAKEFFNRGTKTSYGKIQPEVSDNVVHHFIDTLFSSDKFFLAYNKGELQYTYLIFENGGLPTVK